jgi:peptidoglycan/LPS O-acetylase OafA/YrhL
MATDDRSHGDAFRADLEGLRGVAILLVLLFHAGLPWMTGGFIGVDVFFVLSGFLITGLLYREIMRDGSLDLRAFYARRARRILPASLVVIVATLTAAAFLLDPLDLSRVANDGTAAALSVANLRFAAGAMDYFDASTTPSPLLHYWSLGVEEQFYLVWPALLLIATRLRWRRLGVAWTLVAVIVASFGASLVLTDAAAPWAFYSLPARAWQLALGGLLSLGTLPNIRLVRWPLAALSWAGMAAIVAAGVAFDATTTFPGWFVLLPSAGAAAVILGGDRRHSIGALLATRPLRFLGRISFSLYLVHWPLLVLPAALLPPGANLSDSARIGLAGASIGVAIALHRLVEEPFRRGRPLAQFPGRVLATAAIAVVLVAIASVGLETSATQALDAAGSELVSLNDGPIPSAGAAPTPESSNGTEIGAVTLSPSPTPSPGPSLPGQPSGSITSSSGQSPAGPNAPAATVPSAVPGPVPLPAGIRPSVADARTDRELVLTNGCTVGYAPIRPPECVFGDPNGTRTVALVGDSHASQWFPALDLIARVNHWRLVTFTKLSCRFIDLPIYSRVLKREYTECAAWRAKVVEQLVTLRPDLTVVEAARGPEMMAKADVNPKRQGLAMARLLKPVGGRIAIIVDTPESKVDVPACISGHVADLRPCETQRTAALGWEYRQLEDAAAQALGAEATVVDMSNSICPSDPCPVVFNGMIIYRDDHHMTATFAAAIAGDLLEALPRLAAPPSPSPTPPIGTPIPSEPVPTA